MVKDRRSTFENLLVDINRRVPRVLDEEMRQEICQSMLTDIAQAIRNVLDRSQDYIRKYKKTYPFQMYSLDDTDKRLAETLVG